MGKAADAAGVSLVEDAQGLCLARSEAGHQVAAGGITAPKDHGPRLTQMLQPGLPIARGVLRVNQGLARGLERFLSP